MTGPHATSRSDPPLPRHGGHRGLPPDRRRARALARPDRRVRRPAAGGLWGTEQSSAGLHAPIGFADGRAGRAAAGRRLPARPGRRPERLRQDQPAARHDQLDGQPLRPGRAGALPAGLQGGRLLRPVRPRPPGPRRWLPHARLVGVNINTDREFGLALLRFLADEMRRRAEAAKEHEVTKLEDLRAADRDGRWPRIVAVIDEFQYLFASATRSPGRPIGLLEDVARRGRSQGIHLVLASQDVSGIEAFWGRPAIFEQFVLRIALPRAPGASSPTATRPRCDLPRWHAVVNHESGIRHGNEIVRVPDATARGTVDVVQRHLHALYAAGRTRRRGCSTAPARRASTCWPRGADPGGEPTALVVGQCIDVAGSPATVAAARRPRPQPRRARPGACATPCGCWTARAPRSPRPTSRAPPTSCSPRWSPTRAVARRPARAPGSPTAGHSSRTVALEAFARAGARLAAEVDRAARRRPAAPGRRWSSTPPTPPTPCSTGPAPTRCARSSTSAPRSGCTCWAGGAASPGSSRCWRCGVARRPGRVGRARRAGHRAAEPGRPACC